MWFEATESNTEKFRDKDEWRSKSGPDGQEDPKYVWDLVCTQYCGSRHSMMRGHVYIHPDKADFVAWLRAQQKEYSPPTAAAAAQ
jgi:hypothetical protein